MVTGLFLNLTKMKSLDIDPRIFEKMNNLTYLKFYNNREYHSRYNPDINVLKVNLIDELKYLPDQLRYLHWERYPSKMLPSNFDLDNLVELNLPSSNIEQLWEGKKVTSLLLLFSLYIDIRVLKVAELNYIF